MLLVLLFLFFFFILNCSARHVERVCGKFGIPFSSRALYCTQDARRSMAALKYVRYIHIGTHISIALEIHRAGGGYYCILIIAVTINIRTLKPTAWMDGVKHHKIVSNIYFCHNRTILGITTPPPLLLKMLFRPSSRI